MSEERRLIGNDAKLMRGTKAALVTQVVGETNTIASDTWVMIGAKASTGSLFGALAVGDMYYNTTATAIAPNYVGVGDADAWYPFTFVDMLDLSGWALELVSDKIDVTVIADSVKKYRTGKRDATGSAQFVFIKGVSDIASSGIMDSFFKLVTIEDDGTTIAVTPIRTESYWILGWMDGVDTVVGNHKLATLMEIEFEGFPLNFKMDEASSVDINFHLTGATNPVIYRLENRAP